jgi:hypothetical protein
MTGRSAGHVMTTIGGADDIPHQPMRPIWQFWSGKTAGGLPSRGSFRIEEFLPWVAHIGTVRPEGDPPRMKVTMSSRTMIELNRMDATGKFFNDYMPAYALEFGMLPYLEAMQKRAAIFDCLTPEQYHEAGKSFMRMVMPCADGDGPVNYFFVAIYYDPGFVDRYREDTLYDRYRGNEDERS